MMIHELHSLENEDPLLKEMFGKMCPPGMPKYVLGYLEQMDNLIPQSRFNNFVPDDCKKPSKPEMYKLFSIMGGCEKYKIDTQWIKKYVKFASVH